MSIPLITLTDVAITPELLSAQMMCNIRNTECPVCLEVLSRKQVNIFACHAHAVCGVCAPNVVQCPLCRATEAQVLALYVPIEDVMRALDSTRVEFDFVRIKLAFDNVLPSRSRLSVRQCVALDALSAMLYHECLWSDLWRMKQLSRHLNDPSLRIDGWNDFIKVLTHERTLLLSKTLPRYVDLMQMAHPVKLRAA